MNLTTLVILLVIAVLVVFSGRRMYNSWTGRRDCCASGGDAAAKPKKIRVTDKNEDNYPYTYDLKVSGLACEECVKNVENALNGLGDIWTTVDLKTGKAHIRSKKPIDAEAAAAAVMSAGYYVRRF